jgi:hypothetical protein
VTDLEWVLLSALWVVIGVAVQTSYERYTGFLGLKDRILGTIIWPIILIFTLLENDPRHR